MMKAGAIDRFNTEATRRQHRKALMRESRMRQMRGEERAMRALPYHRNAAKRAHIAFRVSFDDAGAVSEIMPAIASASRYRSATGDK